MKFPDFEYAAPSSVAEALSLLANSKGSAKPLAGGQSLLPMMAFRLARPSLLVDLKGLKELEGIRLRNDALVLGARVRWRDIDKSNELRTLHPLLQAAIRHTAHYQIRNRGTVGGSLAHADPSAEMPGIAATCEAEVIVMSQSGTRRIPADTFFLGPLSTALEPDELLVEVQLPSWNAERRWGFEEFARRKGDFAIAGIATFYDPDQLGRARNVHIGVIGASSRPHRVTEAEAEIEGKVVGVDVIAAASRALRCSIEPLHDLHASAEYRRALAGTLLERALTAAHGRSPAVAS